MITYDNNLNEEIPLDQINESFTQLYSEIFDKQEDIKSYSSYKRFFLDESFSNCFESNLSGDFKKKDNNEILLPFPQFYSIDEIKQNFLPSNLSENIKDLLNQEKKIKRIEKEMKNKLTHKKRRKEGSGKIKFENYKYELENIKEEKKLGRKKNIEQNYSKNLHSIDSADNIIMKIKRIFFNYCLIFLNTTLRLFLNKEKLVYYSKKGMSNNILKKITYINYIQTKRELELLSKPLKEIFSKDISAKYKKISRDHNKKIIEEILVSEIHNKNIVYAFNMTFKEWIDIFTRKKELNFDVVNKEEINSQFVYIDKVIDDMYRIYGDNKKYFSFFILYIYNYERCFFLKKARKRKKN